MLTLLTLLTTLCVASGGIIDIKDAQFDALAKESDIFLNFAPDFCGEACTSNTEALSMLANTVQGKVVVATVDHEQDLVQRFNVMTYPSFIFVRQGSYYVYAGERTKDQFLDFLGAGYKNVLKRAVPVAPNLKTVAVDLTDDTFDQKAFARKGAYWVVLFYKTAQEGTTDALAHFDATANILRGKINFGKCESKACPQIARHLIVDQWPAVYVLRGGQMWRHEHGLNVDDIQAFAEGGFEHVAKHNIQDVKPMKAAEEMEGNVHVLTDDNFDDVTDAMKGRRGTWFVKFYAPWCGHCKAINPAWQEISATLEDELHVGKLDCTVHKNTTERFAIGGFPTLWLFKEGNMYKYNGDKRTAEAFVEFARETYKTADVMPVPPDPFKPVNRDFMTVAMEVPEALQVMWDNSPRGVYGIMGISGALSGAMTLYFMLLRCVLVRAQRSAEKPKSRQAQRARAAKK